MKQLVGYWCSSLLLGDTMLMRWKKSLTGRRVKSTVPTDGPAVADSAVGTNAAQMIVCKLCLSSFRVEQMYVLEQCRCSFCLEVINF